MDLLSEFCRLVRFLKEKSSHLATIVSRALQPHDGRIRCPVDRNCEFYLPFLPSLIDFLFIFGQCLDNCK